jgi:hypothetical protein
MKPECMVTLSCKYCYFQVPTLSLSLCLSIGNYQILYPCYTEQLGYRVLIYILVLKKNTNHVWPEAISTLLLININLVWDMEIISGTYYLPYTINTRPKSAFDLIIISDSYMKVFIRYPLSVLVKCFFFHKKTSDTTTRLVLLKVDNTSTPVVIIARVVQLLISKGMCWSWFLLFIYLYF